MKEEAIWEDVVPTFDFESENLQDVAAALSGLVKQSHGAGIQDLEEAAQVVIAAIRFFYEREMHYCVVATWAYFSSGKNWKIEEWQEWLHAIHPWVADMVISSAMITSGRYEYEIYFLALLGQGQTLPEKWYGPRK